MFTDLEESVYKAEIEFLHKMGVVGGYNDGTFKPDKEITKVEFLKIILNILGYQQKNSDTKHWAVAYIDIAETIGFLEKGEYRIEDLDNPITKGEMEKIVITALRFKGEELTIEEKMTYEGFYENMHLKEIEADMPYIKGILTYDFDDNRLYETLTREKASVLAARIFNEKFRVKSTLIQPKSAL